MNGAREWIHFISYKSHLSQDPQTLHILCIMNNLSDVTHF